MVNQDLKSVISERLNSLIPENKDKSEEAARRIERLRRNIEIYKRYYGFDGNGGLSMDKTGKHYGLTRESVRQITDKITKMLRMSKEPVSNLKNIVDLIDSLVPASAEKIEKELISHGYISDDFLLEGIVAAANVFGVKTKVEKVINVNGHRFAVQERFEDAPRVILSQATKEISHNGAINVNNLMKDAHGISKEIKFQFVQSVLNTVSTTTWITDHWVHFGDKGVNRFIERLKRIFAANESVHIDQIEAGIARNWNKNKKERTYVLPKDIILALITSLGDYVVKSGGLVYSVNPLEKSTLSEMEIELYDTLKNAPDSRMREKELEDAIVGDDQGKKFNFSQVLNYSPIIYRPEWGIYTILGNPR